MRYLAAAAAIGLLAGVASAAQASDVSAPVVINGQNYNSAPAAHDWTGLYVGGNIGGVWGKYKDVTAHWPPSNSQNFGDFASNGYVLNGALGWNVDRGPLVMGLEAGATWSNRNISDTVKQDWTFDLYGRFGIPMAGGKLLPYVKAGPSITHVNVKDPTLGFDTWMVGGGVGGGVDYALTERISLNVDVTAHFYPHGSRDFGSGVSADWKADDITAGAGFKVKLW
ncbi:MAG TPA: outer membrane beta-barrel protein [Candidatus Paceibacterota bacterium]|nr:outer membrane beta-barrel protein [Candidatus Paceibacterota bacterium]